MTNWPIKREFGEQIIGSGGKITVESGGEVDLETGAVFQMGGVAVTASGADMNKLAGVTLSAAQINALVGGVAGAYRLARGVHETVAASDTVVTGLTTVVAVAAVLEDDPTVDPLFVSCSIGDQAGAPAAGSVYIKSWKPTAVNDVTPIAATTFGKKVNWIAIGT
jgi:hypothetical protein